MSGVGRTRHLIMAAALLLLNMVVPRAGATRLRVPTDYERINAAIAAAVDGDTVWVLPGTYEEAIRFWGKRIVVRSSAPEDSATVAETVINARDWGDNPVVTFADDEDSSAVLSGFTLREGRGRVRSKWYYGSGIYLESAAPTIRFCQVRDNLAPIPSSAGGGIYVGSGGQLRLFDSVVEQNGHRSTSGGGIYVSRGGSARLEGCRVVRNSGYGAIRLEGGSASLYGCRVDDGIHATNADLYLRDSQLVQGGSGLSISGSTAVVENSLIADNSYEGIHAWRSSLEVRDCHFRDNGWYGLQLSWMDAAVFTRCVFHRFSGSAPAIDCHNCYAEGSGEAVITLEQCVFFDNQNHGSSSSGVILFDRSSAAINQCSIFGNFRLLPEDPIVMVRDPLGGDALTTIRNSIIWGNWGTAVVAEDSVRVEVAYSDIEGGWPGEGNIDADPRLTHIYRYPGFLLAGSPAIDSGDPELRDQVSDWHPRWPENLPNGPAADMGAYGGPHNGLWWRNGVWGEREWSKR